MVLSSMQCAGGRLTVWSHYTLCTTLYTSLSDADHRMHTQRADAKHPAEGLPPRLCRVEVRCQALQAGDDQRQSQPIDAACNHGLHSSDVYGHVCLLGTSGKRASIMPAACMLWMLISFSAPTCGREVDSPMTLVITPHIRQPAATTCVLSALSATRPLTGETAACASSAMLT